jgi:hypothetical protein
MVASHLIWLLRTKDMRQRAKAAGQSFDESEECVQWQAHGLDLKNVLSRAFSGKERAHGDSESDHDGTGPLVVPQNVVPKTVPNAVV